MSLHSLLPLESLRPGERAEVSDVAGDPAWVARFAELGLRPGAALEMLRGGSPCLVHVAGARLSLRGGAEVTVLVRLLAGERR